MLWNQQPERYGRFLTGVAIPMDEAMIRLGPNLLPSIDLSDDRLVALTDEDIAARSGLDLTAFKQMIAAGIRDWRNSPSRSLINLLACDTSSNAPIFRTMREQTRAIVALSNAGILDLNRGGPVRAVIGDDRKPVQISGSSAMTLAEDGYAPFCSAMTALRLWAGRNAARVRLGEIKLPKILHRGIRLKDVPADVEHGADDPFPIRSCRRLATAERALAETPLAALSHSSILSFTAQRPIAEYFTKNEGFVVDVDPSKVEVIASWSTDEHLDGHDVVHGRHEREWILRIPPDLVLDTGAIHKHDYVWHRSFAEQKAVAMVEHYDVADYMLDGRKVRAWFMYRSSGNGGAVRYQVGDDLSSRSRAATRKAIGFDPLPSDERPATDLVFRYRDPFLPRSNKDYDILTLDDLDPPSTPSP